MKRFDYVRPGSCAEASAELTEGAVYMAGGSDLLGALKQDILPKYPKKLVSLRDIPDMRGVKLEDGALKLDAMTTLGEVCESETVKNSVPALAEAAHSVATPLVRNIGTVGGNLCQDVRCWFYRYPNEIGGRLDCARKGGQENYPMPEDAAGVGTAADRESGNVIAIGVVTRRKTYSRAGYLCQKGAPPELHAAACALLELSRDMPVIKTVLLRPEEVCERICGGEAPPPELLRCAALALAALRQALSGCLAEKTDID